MMNVLILVCVEVSMWGNTYITNDSAFIVLILVCVEVSMWGLNPLHN